MKRTLTLLTFLGHLLLFSQNQKQFVVEWNGIKTLSTGSHAMELPSFSDDNYSYDASKGLKFVSQWPISGDVNQPSVRITQIEYEPISLAELKDLPLALIPDNVNLDLRTSIARDDKTAFLALSPIIKRGNSYEKVTFFSITYSENNTNATYTRGPNSITHSLLASGDWYRFYVDTTGVFKLSKGFLERLGMNLNGINPQEIKIYGNGGKMIPYSNAAPYPIDPEENAILVVGEEDGVFNDSDYILFFAQGPNGWDAEKETNINCYNSKTYYYITAGSGNGKRIQPMNQSTGTPDFVVDTFEEYQYHETDDYNLVQVGRRWFGNRFGVETTRSFEFEFPDLVTTEPIQLKVVLASTSETSTSMDVSFNGSQISTLTLPGVSGSTLASGTQYNGSVNSGTSTVNVTLDFNNAGNPSALAYVDFISLEATRSLTFSGKQYVFRKRETALQPGIAQYNLSNASNVQQVWEVTDIYNVTSIDNTDAGATFSFNATAGTQREFVIVSSQDYYEPKIDGITQIENQNIKGTIFNNSQGVFQDIDYLIVAPSYLLTQAERLAQINRDVYGLNVKVLTLQAIYNEFGVGSQDIGAIRNAVKYIYDNASVPDNRIKYLCLFGDTSFDYKDRLRNNTNIVPSWHSYNSFNLTNAFVSDDFFGMMDPAEGSMSTFDKLDIAVGRMIIDSPQQAKEMVDKVELYHKNTSMGNWRNSFVVVSDDVDTASEDELEQTTDSIGNLVAANKPFINVTKIHSDAYQQQSTSGGDRYPDVKEAMVSAIEKGALVVNYFGHGGEDGLAHERIFQKPDILDLNNLCKFNCFVTITCEFTRFDNPLRPTAGELTFWNTQGGSIGLITTTRQIFVSTGIAFNYILEEYLFSYNSTDAYEDYEYPSMAEALRLTKVNPSISGREQRLLVFFIGDPAMKLAIGAPNIELTHINDVPLGQNTDNLAALSRVKLSGRVTDPNGNLMAGYNGTLSATIYDKDIQRQTLGNDGTQIGGQVFIMDYETLGPVIFRGQASISNGLFEFEFVVPRDIAIPLGTGKVSFYATNEDLTQDNTGASVDEVVVGGINDNAPEDNQGPVIQLYMNDENFVSGGITNESPILLAKLQDENGINTASGIGHDITAILDGDETNPFIVNDYYETEVDDYQRGTVSYPLRNLEPGLHTLTFKAWDVYNNSSTAEIQFMVFDEDKKLVVENVLNYPNPFVNYTEFWFNHNSSAPLDVSVQIFTVSGKLVKTINTQTNGGDCCNQGSSSLSRDIVWDGRDDFGDKIGKGVYVYKLTVFSPALNKKVEKIEKLVIL